MATDFKVTLELSGGDYSLLSTAESDLQNDLTVATIKVFSISAVATGGIADDQAVTGVTSGATGTLVKQNFAETQVLIKSITGTFQSGEVVEQDSNTAKTVTLSDAGDSPNILYSPHNDFPRLKSTGD